MEAGRVGEGQGKTFLRKGVEERCVAPPVGRRRPFEDRSVKKTLTLAGPLMEAATAMERSNAIFSRNELTK
jgi:hypothetical protein